MLDDLSSDGSFIANVPIVKHSFLFQPTCPPTAWTVEEEGVAVVEEEGEEVGVVAVGLEATPAPNL